MKEGFCFLTGAVGATVAAFFGGWSSAMITLCIFMAIDYISGIVVAGVFHKSKKTKSGTLKSDIGFKGLCKKGAELLLVLVACRLDITLGMTYIQDIVIIALITNETISIIENFGLMGVPIPEALIKAIDLLQNKAGEKEGKENEDNN